MSIAALALKLRRFRHGFGIRAHRLEVRPGAVWYAYALMGAVAALVLVGCVWFLLHLFRPAEFRDTEELKERLVFLETQLLQGEGSFSNLQAAQSANQSLSAELRAQVDEQAVLKDDLAYFMRLVPVGTAEGGVRLDRLVIRPNPQSQGQYRFSVFVGYDSGRQPREFVGNLEFVVTLLREGKEQQLTWPPKSKDKLPEFMVTTRHWLRKEGVIEMLPGDVIKRVELKLLQGGVVKAKTTAVF